ncbi:phenylacetaldehyde reductase-like isoform X2 [Rosa rugosa]|uniref:phenylacetaldehyde reductase-like isoform X2 n=1 Tax=Rosa rugosa TaxID=74645 RepID=UPI002B400CFD|nr:phenylacetaldehyde reductase-like isoform X2 [Rosa rugosa]
MSGERKVVCVTGASGFIASWLVKLLLQRGYVVKATVRDPNNPKKTEHLLSLEGAKERLHLFKADLLEEGSFDLVVDGCEGVFHTASPVLFSSISDPQAEQIDPAVKGTLNVLKSCVKFPTIKRVVLTSSMAAVVLNGRPLTSNVVVDETWFSDPLVCEELKEWYFLSKTLAEEAAWKFAKENGIDMVTINPSYVIDIDGITSANYTSTDVRDVASAHIQAFEVPSASGRYCLVANVTPIHEALKILKELHPTLCPTEICEQDIPSAPEYQISQEKAKSLGLDFLPFEVSLRDTIECLKEKGFLEA